MLRGLKSASTSVQFGGTYDNHVPNFFSARLYGADGQYASLAGVKIVFDIGVHSVLTSVGRKKNGARERADTPHTNNTLNRLRGESKRAGLMRN